VSLERPTDAALAKRSAKKNQAALAVLVSRHWAMVRAMSHRLTKGGADSDDIAQSAFLTAWRRIETYAGGSFKSWLGTVTYREFLQYYKKRRDEVEFDETYHGESCDPSQRHYSAQLDLETAMKSLSEKQRICVILCVATGLSHSEAATATGWPLGTVKSHVNRGVAQLRKFMEVDNVA